MGEADVVNPPAKGGPLVSVVTPVYNDASHIGECIASVLRQTYTHLDYTVIDNASTDETPEIVADFARRDSRVRLLRFEELVDTTQNHNRAFRAISPESEFCKVVQADDWLYDECLERMVAVAQEAETIGVVSAYRLWQDQVDLVGLPYSETIVSGRKILRQCLTGGPYVTGAPTAVLYRSEVVRERDPFYLADYEHADTEATYWVLSRRDFGFVHQVLTFARRERGRRQAWADAMNTYDPENIRFLLLYGPGVLGPAEYRERLRLELRRYVRFHARQLPKPSRLREPDFFALHHKEIDAILEDGGDDPEVRLATSVVRAMLARGGRRRVSSAIR